jgi:drug/metabolite transporter (DMT)-like permease
MGVPGLAVAVFFATASVAFVMAIQYTSIANVILIGAAVPLVAAVIGRVLFRTPVSRATWIAIAAVLAGVSVMVVGPDQTGGAALGNALAVLMTFAFAGATVVTRQYHGIRMTPAVCTAMILAASVAAANASGFAASGRDFALLFTFGALNLGLGMAFFVTGARLIPAALTALLGTAETVLQPIWVWLFHGEIPAARSLTGGAIVLVALVVHILLEARRSRPDGPTVPTPP